MNIHILLFSSKCYAVQRAAASNIPRAPHAPCSPLHTPSPARHQRPPGLCFLVLNFT